MVAEAVATPATETQTQGNADALPADAVESKEVNAYFDARDKGSEEKAAPESEAGEVTPPVEEFPQLAEARKAAADATEERVARETTARIEREERERQTALRATEEGRRFQENFAARVNSTRDEVYADLTRAGYDHEAALAAANRIAGRLNEHHADGLKLYAPQAFAQAEGEFINNFNGGIRAALDSDEQRAFFGTTDKPVTYGNVTEAIAAVKAAATAGMVTKTEAKAEAKLEVLKYQKYLEEKGMLVGTRSQPNGVNGNTPTSANEPKDWNEVTLMVTGSHPSGRTLSTAEARAYAQRFGHRIPR